MDRFCKKCVCALVAALICAGLAVPALAGFNNETRDGVVYLEWYGPYITEKGELDISKWNGTGFFVGDPEDGAQYLVTNYHVASGMIHVDQVVKDNYAALERVFGADKIGQYQFDTQNAKSLFPLYVAYAKDDYEEVYEVAYNKEKDLAVLRIDSPTDKRRPLPLKTLSEDLIGDVFYAVGYPGVADRVWDSVQSYGKSDVTVTTGTINRIITVSGTGMKIYQTDVKIRGGNSGGPLVDADGNVVGINFQGASAALDPNLNYAICTDELIPLLTNNNVSYQLASDASAAPEPSAVPTPEPLPDPTPEPEPAPGSVTIPLAIPLALVCAGAAGWWFAKKRKAAPAAISVAPTPIPVTAPSQVPPSASGAPAHLICTRGRYAGTTFPISGSLSLGRDPQRCQIVFPSDTKGISSLHCEVRISPTGSGVVLTDRGSSYGTFLSGGRRLNANESVALTSGSSFYLADHRNEFKVL